MTALEVSFIQITAMAQEQIMNDNSGRIVSREELSAALHELQSLLSMYDTGAGDVLFRIRPALIRLGLETEVARLETAASRYAFEEAEIICSRLIQRLGDN